MAAPQATAGRRLITRIAIRSATCLAAIYLVLCVALYWAMTRPPDVFGRIMARVPLPLMIVLPFETLWKRSPRNVRFRESDPGVIALANRCLLAKGVPKP